MAFSPDGKLLVVINGAYGKRVAKMASILKIPVTALEFPENQKTDPKKVEAALKADPKITNVSIVHCETTSGIVNPIREIGAIGFHPLEEIIGQIMALDGRQDIDDFAVSAGLDAVPDPAGVGADEADPSHPAPPVLLAAPFVGDLHHLDHAAEFFTDEIVGGRTHRQQGRSPGIKLQ